MRKLYINWRDVCGRMQLSRKILKVDLTYRKFC